MISADTQINICNTNRHGKRKAILGPAGRTLHAWPAGKKPWAFYSVSVQNSMTQFHESSLSLDFLVWL